MAGLLLANGLPGNYPSAGCYSTLGFCYNAPLLRLFNLEKLDEGEKDVQVIDLDSVMKKCVVTLLVMSIFS